LEFKKFDDYIAEQNPPIIITHYKFDQTNKDIILNRLKKE